MNFSKWLLPSEEMSGHYVKFLLKNKQMLENYYWFYPGVRFPAGHC